MFTLIFWKAAVERAIKTSAQVSLLVLGADQINVFSADWATVGGFALGGAALSLLTSVASSAVGAEDSPSLVNGEL